MIGELIGGRWEVVAKAGAGGMGVVYRATDRETGQLAALKVMADDVWATDRFWQEADVLSGIAHPAVVRYLGRGSTPNGQPFLAMEWLDGEDLDQRLERGALGIAETLVIAQRVIGALEAAHARGVVHRDLKPSNLFLVGADATRVKLLDFGVARAALRTQKMTQTGAVLGTIGYMAPEQATGARDVDGRADLFSLGCVLYECLAGMPAFAGAHLVAVLGKVLREDPPDIRSYRRDTPPAIVKLLAQLLAKRREDRPPSATVVREALEAIEGNSFTEAAGSSPVLVRRSEQRLVSALLVDASEGVVKDATLTPDELAKDAQHARRIAEKYSGEAVMLANHCLLVTLPSMGSVSDQVQRAAACALEVAAAYPGAAVALATGRTENSGRTPVGPVIERAAELLEGAIGRIAVDELTARFAEARFEVRAEGRRWHLLGVRADADDQDARRLLGKTTPCVGRRKELALLEATLDECIDERVARVVVVTAPAGMGKSRLRRELVKRVVESGKKVRILRGRGELLARQSSMAIARQLLRAAIGAPEGTPEERARERLDARIDDVVPAGERPHARELLAELLGITRPEAPSETLRAAREDARVIAERLKQAFATWLAAETTRETLLVVLDDLHWIDESSLRYIDAALEVAPMMVVGLGRPDDADRFADFGERAGRQDVRLQPLSDKAASELVRAALPNGADEAVRRIVERAEGNAFYLEELIRRVAEGGSDELPETVIAMAQSRIERLEPDARQVLRAASVFGDVFHEGAVASLLGQSESTREWLATLVDRELLVEHRESRYPKERQLAFRHALLREAAYAMLADSDRTACHRLAGEWLERIGEPDALVLASHFERARDDVRAVRHLVAGARAAASVYAHDRAAAVVGRALELVRARPASAERDGEELALLLAQTPSLRAAHGYTDRTLLAVLERARMLAESLDDTPTLFQVLRNLWGHRFVAGDLHGALDIARTMARLASELPGLEAVGQHALAGTLTHAGELRAAIDHFELARRKYDPTSSGEELLAWGSDLGVFNNAWEAHALWLYGLEDRAVASANEAVRTARTIGHAYSEALAQAYAAVLHYMRGDRSACAEASDSARELCARYGFAYYGHWGTVLGAWSRHEDDPKAAARAMRGALEALDAEGSPARRPIYLAAMAEVLAAAGAGDEAIAALDEAEAYVASSGDRMWSSELARLRSGLVPEHAIEHAHRALDRAMEIHARPLVVRSAVTLARAVGRSAAHVVRDALATLPDDGGSFDRKRAITVLYELA